MPNDLLPGINWRLLSTLLIDIDVDVFNLFASHMLVHKSYNDDELLFLLKADKDIALKYIYNKYWKALYLHAFSTIRDAAPCEDIVQEVLLQLWVRKDEVVINSLKSYLFTSVRYKVLSYIRSAHQRKIFIEPGELEQLAGIEELKDRLNELDIKHLLDRGIQTLPQRCKEVFIFSRKENLSNKEIAKRMDISVKTVEAQMTIALRQLKANMAEFLACLCLVLPFLKK